MKNYTKEQLEKAMVIYYKDTLEYPDDFKEKITNPEEDAIIAVEYLLNIIKEHEI